MSQIKISCIGSSAIFTDTPDIFSGGNVDTVKFTFDSEWSEFTTKTAVFYNTPKETSFVILNSDNVCTIPPERIAQKGKLSIGVMGTKANGDRKTSKILTYVVGKGAISNEMETTSATPDVWLQLLSIVEDNNARVNALNTTVNTLNSTVHSLQVSIGAREGNINLLDNWDFSNPVNQRGQTTYSKGGAYTIDRWKASGTGTLTLNSGYISLQRTGTWYNFSQTIDNPARFAGKTLTLSAKGSGHYSIIFNVNSSSTSSFPASMLYNSSDVGVVSVTYTLPDDVTMLTVVIQSKDTAVVNNIYSVKLEIGEISTLENDTPMDYQSEYLKCLRYYYKGPISFINAVLDSSKECYFCSYGYFPVPMRTAPTVVAINQGNISDEVKQNTYTNKYCIRSIYMDELFVNDNKTLSSDDVEVSADL